MDENILNAYIPDWLNYIFFTLFRHLPVKRSRALAKNATPRKLSPELPSSPHYSLRPQTTSLTRTPFH